MNKCWNTQTQVFGFRNRFSKLQKLKFHIKQVNYYLRWTIVTCRLASLPEKPATIDWSHYRSVVAKAGMVDEFEKKVRSSGCSVSVYYCDTCLIRFCFSIYSSLHWRSLSQWTLRQLRLIPRSRKLWVSRHTSAKAFQYCDLNEHTKDIPFHLNTPIYGNKPQDYPQLDWTF